MFKTKSVIYVHSVLDYGILVWTPLDTRGSIDCFILGHEKVQQVLLGIRLNPPSHPKATYLLVLLT